MQIISKLLNNKLSFNMLKEKDYQVNIKDLFTLEYIYTYIKNSLFSEVPL